jgi:glycosyltransferase involved in cell wall biosynthesis
MKVAIIGNFKQETTSAAGGGTYAFTYSLAEELAKRESVESIDVYGSGKSNFSQKKINYISVLPASIDSFINHDEMLNQINSRENDFFAHFIETTALKVYDIISKKNYDIIHNNAIVPVINSVMRYITTPVITTTHANVDHSSILIPFKLGFLNQNTNNKFIAVANHQKTYAEKLNININYYATVYNGIDCDSYQVKENTSNKEYGIWVGRIFSNPNKGLKEALLASKKSNKNLVVLTSLEHEEYYNKEIKPLLDETVTFIPESKKLSLQKKIEYYQNSSYFLFPIIWEEPFGLVFMESMACGTPVIAFARGAVPEIIKDGQTGFIVNASDEDIRGEWIVKKTGVEGLCEAIEKINNMPAEEYYQMRLNCRKHVEEHFTIERMVNDYIKVYNNILTASKNLSE